MHTTPRTRNCVPSTLRRRLFAFVILATLCYLYLYVKDGILRGDNSEDDADSLTSNDSPNGWNPTRIFDTVNLPRQIRTAMMNNEAATSNPFMSRWWGHGQVPKYKAPPLPTPLVSPHHKANGNGVDKHNRGPPKSIEYVPPPLHRSYQQVIHALSAADKALLPKIQEEYMTSTVSDDPKCGTWQSRYRELHKNIVSNTTSNPRTIMYLCRRYTNCGGLADRIVGMVSTFIFALLDDRAFLAKWEVPLPMEVLFDSPSVDWSLNDRPGDIVRAQGFDQDQGKEFNWIHYHKNEVDSTFIDSEKTWDELFPEPHLTFMTNRGMAIRLARSKKYAERLQELGFSVDTIFSCALEFIITPRPSILQFISKFVSIFRLPSVFSVGIQIRTGDSAMRDPKSDQTALSGYEHYFKCADELSGVYAQENQIVVYFLVTDSIHLREEAAKRYSNPSASGNSTRYVLVSGVPIAHTHRSSKVSDAAGSIVENWALAATNYRVISQGGYGKIASFRSRAQNTTVVLTPQGNLKLHKLRNRPIPDCREPSAFTSFESMANVWSLG